MTTPPPMPWATRFDPPAVMERRETFVTAYGEHLDGVEALGDANVGNNTYTDRPFTIVNAGTLTYTTQAFPAGGGTVLRLAYDGWRSHTMRGPRVIGGGPPSGRGRWRILYARRGFTTTVPDTVEGEIMDARSRRLERQLNSPARFSFAVDGHSPTAAALRELEHDLLVYRWNEVDGRDEEMFRGPVVQTQDTLSEQLHTVTVNATDYLGVIGRRFLTAAAVVRNGYDQDIIVLDLFNLARLVTATGPPFMTFYPASELPVTVWRVYPDGTVGRALSGRLRDRTYYGQTNIGEAIDNLANVIDGYDYDVAPVRGGQFTGVDRLRVFYPYQGVQRTDFAFVYGSTVSALSRSVNSAAFGNYVRVLGQSEEGAPQVFAEAWTDDVNDLVANPRGFWPLAESASDVTEVATLREKAAGTIAEASILVPAYSLTVRPGAYYSHAFDIGDTVGLQVRSGRLDVDTWVRVLGLAFAIGDDLDETIEVDVGRPGPDFLRDLRTNTARIGALERR